METHDQHHASTAYLQEIMPVPTEQEAGWAPEEAWIIWRMGKSLVFKARMCNPQHSQYIYCTIPAPSHTLSILTQHTLTVSFKYAATVTQATTAQNGTTGGLPWLRWQVTGLSLQWLRGIYRSSPMWCVVEEVLLTEDFLSVLWLSHQHHFTNAPYSFIHHWCCIILATDSYIKQWSQINNWNNYLV
jgi:hypothetical protein